MLYKKCRICGEMKEVVEFHKKKGAPDGVRNECKECVKILLKKYKEAKIAKTKSGSGEPIALTATHLAGKTKKTKVSQRGFSESLNLRINR